LNELFRSKIIRVINKNASVLASSLIGIHEDNFEQIAVPYLNKKSLKEYTLVLDLDETLIHFKIDNNDDNKGLLRLRPGIFDFLDSMTCIYEIVIFTAATQEVIMY
jgi:TFIIF-interacting CTD phosphatase-like protein